MNQSISKSLNIWLITLLCVSGFQTVKADIIELDGLNYDLNLNDHTASIISQAMADDISAVTINEKVTYENEDYSVTSIGDNAFENCTNLKRIKIPNSIILIGNNAFKNCSALSQVALSNSIISIGDNAFSGCTSLLAITIPENVSSIESSVFYGCTSLSEIELPENVSTIGESAFYGCTSLSKITLPENVSTIGASAFSGCTNLSEITLPENLTAINNSTFGRCTNLSDITIPENVSSIGGGAFYGCTSLSEIVLPNNIKEIMSNTFYGCSSLTKIIIPDNVITIGSSAFKDCSNLTYLTLGERVESIEDQAFSNCKKMWKLTIPNSVTSIGHSAFSGCRLLSNITIGSSVKTIGSYAFDGCNGISTIKFEDSDEELDLGYNNTFDKVYLENLYIGRDLKCEKPMFSNNILWTFKIGEKVTTIKENSFQNCSGLKSLTIPKSVTSIGKNAFKGCPITNVTFEDGEEELELDDTNNIYGFFKDFEIQNLYLGRILKSSHRPFSNITTLTTLTINIPNIHSNEFSGCTGLSLLNIGSNVTTIGDYSFQNCWRLSSLTIPNSVTSIGNKAFNGCPLTFVTFEDGEEELKLLGDNTCSNEISGLYLGRNLVFIESPFSYRTNLRSLTIGNTVTSICNNAFYACTGLKDLTLGNSIEIIGDSAFSGCTELTDLTLGNSIEIIGANAFSRCTGLTDLTLGNSIEIIGDSAFSGCTGLGNIKLPESLISIGNSAFWMCSGICEINIPNNVTSIGQEAFSYCSGLSKLTIGDSVESIGEGAFYNCNITEITTNVFSIEGIADCGLSSDIPVIFNYTNQEIITPSETLIINHFKDVVVECNNNQYAIILAPDYISFSNAIYKNSEFSFVPLEDKSVARTNNDQIKLAIHYGKVITESLSDGYEFYPYKNVQKNIFYIYDNDINSEEVTVSKAGNLWGAINSDIEKIQYLKITGNLNGTDIALINEMISLIALDISEANILEGGSSYYESNYKTKNNEVGSYFFHNINLQYIYLPNSATLIDSNALKKSSENENSDLKCIIIGNSVSEINNNAFENCVGMHSITIPSSVKSIGDSAFDGCTNLCSVIFNDDDEILNLGKGGSVINFRNVGLFYDCPIENIYLGRNINCNKQPFIGITSLVSLTIGDKVLSIDDLAFSSCTGLNKLTIGNSVQSIGLSAFSSCTGLNELTIGNSVQSIGSDAFSSCTGLNELTIGNSVQSIGGWAFSDCSGLSSVKIPSSVKSIDKNAFSNCSSISKVEFESIEAICNIEFGNYGANPTNNNAHLYIGENEVTELVIPTSVNSIGSYAFIGCSGLTSVEIPTSVTSIGKNAFKDCTGLSTVSIPNSVDSIKDSTFAGCIGLTSVEIPSSVSSIGMQAFCGCSKLTSVNLPNSINTIEEAAFYRCDSLMVMYCLALEPPICNGNVSSIPYNQITLYVPKGTKEKYQGASLWKNCKEILEIGDLSIKMEAMSLASGETTIIEPEIIKSEDITIVSQIWSSSNISVAVVEDGVVTCVGEGIAIVTLTIIDSLGQEYSASCTITVNPPVLVNSIEISCDFTTLKKNRTTALSAEILPKDASNKIIEWKSSDESVATIDNKGIVTTKKAGSVIFYAYATDGSNVSSTFAMSVISPLKGDSNDDDLLSIDDAVRTANYAVGIIDDSFCMEAADINEDGKVSIGDAYATVKEILNQEIQSYSRLPLNISAPEGLMNCDYLAMEDFDLAVGRETTVDVVLENTVNYVGLQADIFVPEGMAIVGVEAGPRVTADHSLIQRRIDERTVRVILFDGNNSEFADNQEPILRITVISNDFSDGFVKIENIFASDSSAQCYKLASLDCNANTSGVDAFVSDDDIDIKIISDCILISNAEGKEVCVHNIDGLCVEKFIANSNSVTKRLDKGVYILTSGKKSAKIIIR